MLHLAMKAFYPEKPPFPFMHIDTTWKFKDMIKFRDDTAKKLGIEMIVYSNEEGIKQGINPFDSTLAAEYLKKPLDTSVPLYLDPDIPPTARIEGVDLVTEGVITFSRVREYADDYLKDNRLYTDWSYKKDGASQIARMLFEEATDVNFFVGRAVNPAHQNPDLPIGFSIKMQLVERVANDLREMGKRITVSYY